MSVIRLPSWGEVLSGPWALRLRSGPTGAWLMRGEAEAIEDLDCRFVVGVAARTTGDALAEIGDALELEVPLGGALRAAADRVRLHVIFQARELTPDAEAVLAEFGVAEIAA